MSELGLFIIILAWVIQLMNKGKNLDIKFVGLYAIGVMILAIDGYKSNLTTLAVLNTISFVVAVAVFLKNKK